MQMGNIFKRYKKSNNSEKIKKEGNSGTSQRGNDIDNKPSFVGMAKNLFNSLKEWQSAGRPVVTSEQWDYRVKICRGCEFWHEVGETQIARCKKCGCSSGKLLLATSKCPLNPPKWNSIS